jgi:hypothetical protein
MGPGIVEQYASDPDKYRPEPVIWVAGPVQFSPWLYVEHLQVLDEQIGKFGFYIEMCKGLNTFSTPISLQADDPGRSRTWDDIFANSDLTLVNGGTGKVKYVLQWTGTSWTSPSGTDEVLPLEAYYIYMMYPGENIILFVDTDTSMPTRNLPAGWSLIGPNPLFGAPGMQAKFALESIEQTAGGLPGYSQVISPVVWCQNAWVYVPGMMGPYVMESGRGYWVWMQNPGILAGFGFTPLPAGP